MKPALDIVHRFRAVRGRVEMRLFSQNMMWFCPCCGMKVKEFTVSGELIETELQRFVDNGGTKKPKKSRGRPPGLLLRRIVWIVTYLKWRVFNYAETKAQAEL